MSNRLVTTWNSAIASRLNFGCPKPPPATCWVISWPSRLSWKARSRTPGLVSTWLAVMPLTCIASSIQLRPCSGSSSIWRRSTLPATWVELMSTSGDSPVTVTVSVSVATCMAKGTERFCPTSSSTSGTTIGGEARKLGLQLVAAGRQAAQPVLAALVADVAVNATGGQRGRGDRDARQRAARRIGHGAENGSLLRERRGCDQHDGGCKKTDGTHAHIAPFPWRGIPDEPDETPFRVSVCNGARRVRTRKLARTIAHGSHGLDAHCACNPAPAMMPPARPFRAATAAP